jgi:hypothetical protein
MTIAVAHHKLIAGAISSQNEFDILTYWKRYLAVRLQLTGPSENKWFLIFHPTLVLTAHEMFKRPPAVRFEK